MTRIVGFANLVLSSAGLYLAWLYGDLHWWYRDARKAGHIDHDLGHRFLGIADQLPIVAIVVTTAAAISAISLWKSNAVGKRLGVVLILLALSCWIASVAFWL